MKTIGSKLKYLREINDYSQKRVATAVGISNVQLSRYESGDRTPDPYILKKLADFYNVNMDYFVTEGSNAERQIQTSVGDKQFTLTEDEFLIFQEMKKHALMFNDLKTDPERKVKQLIKMWKFIKEDMEETDDEDVLKD